MTVHRDVIREVTWPGGRDVQGRGEEARNAQQVLDGKRLHEVDLEDWKHALVLPEHSDTSRDVFAKWLHDMFAPGQTWKSYHIL
jgi:hypothetical protein